MPLTACVSNFPGFLVKTSRAVSLFNPPGNPLCLMYSFWSHFWPESVILSALMTTTWSPQSICGEKIGLFFPLSITAISVASFPRVLSSASTKYHFLCLSISASFGENVLKVMSV